MPLLQHQLNITTACTGYPRSRHDLSKKTYKVKADITFNNITCELFYNAYMSTKMHLNNMHKICPTKNYK